MRAAPVSHAGCKSVTTSHFRGILLAAAAGCALRKNTDALKLVRFAFDTANSGRMSRFSLSHKTLVTLGFVIPLLLIGIPALLTSRSDGRVKDSFGWVTHTFEVQTGVQNLVNSLVDAETGQRGFLLTQKRYYLEPYEAARPRIARELRDLKDLTADNQWQQERLAQVDPLVAERLKLLDETVALESRGEHAAALELVNSDRGKNVMDKIRSVLRVISEEEQRLLWVRQQQLSKESRGSTLLLRLLVAASALCGLGLFYLLHRLSKLEPVVQMCAHSRTIEYEGDWLSFEEYLQRRFNLKTSHGLSPAEFEKLRGSASP